MAIVRLRPAELKRAIADGVLTLHFQPQVHVPSGKLVGVEAFVRWAHPSHGMIGPSDIVPLLDQGGLHEDFDQWVLGAVCTQLQRWRIEGVDVPIVAANLWAHTLRAPHIVDTVRATFTVREVDPRLIEIECPKGSVRDPLLAEPVQRIRALGVRTASEEFDDPAIAGAASGFDTLKIGWPIVRDLAIAGSGSVDAVRAIVEAARAAGGRVVADSVETKEQEDALVALGCDIVQGYLYGPEVGPDELRTLLAHGAGEGE